MIIHVTGGSGFLGGHVLARLVDHGHEVSALARSTAAAEQVRAGGATPVIGNLDDAGSVREAFKASCAEALMNLASLGFGHAATIVAAAEAAGIQRAVFVSTTAIYTKLNAQSRAVRVAAEDCIQASRLDWTIVRPTMIYGTPRDRNMARLIRTMRRWPVVAVPGTADRLQQPVHVDDLADALVAAVECRAAVGAAYDVAGPEPLTLRQIMAQTADAVGRTPRLVTIPLAPAIAGLRLYERAVRHPRLRAEQLERLTEDKVFDISAACQDLGYRPRSFAEGIRAEAAMLPNGR